MDYTVHEILQAGILELGSRSLLQGIFPTQRLNPGLATLLVDFFPTQKLNQSLLHCRRILYQLAITEAMY